MSIVPQKPVIYQLAVRYFGNTNSTNRWAGSIADNGCRRFSDINDAAIDSLVRLGVTHVWLTGCLRQATLTSYPQFGLDADDPDIVKGRAGSFYAVKDYFDVCPDYAQSPPARMQEFEQLIERLHTRSLQVLLDFVPNHVARSYHSIIRPTLDFGVGDDQAQFFNPNNCFFYLVDPPNQSLRLSRPDHWNPPSVSFDSQFTVEDGRPAHRPKATADASKHYTTASPSSYGWYEAVKLNYGFNYVDGTTTTVPIPRTWTIVDEIIRYWQSKRVDGFRCDMAHMIPKEAWNYIITHAREPGRNPNAYFLAEAYVNPHSDDPVRSVHELLDAGFNAVYHDDSHDLIRRIYNGSASLADYDGEMRTWSERERSASVDYLENHDKQRVAGAISSGGFGSLDANYQLAPLQLLYSSGPALIFNGQEVGEPGSGFEGFDLDNGHTTFFDYWTMPEFLRWVNGHSYDGAYLSPDQKRLRTFFGALLALCQDRAVRGAGCWGLKYFNNAGQFADCPDDLYSFARFEPGGGRLIIVAANFRPNSGISAQVRVPRELINAANLSQNCTIRLVLSRNGAQNVSLGLYTKEVLTSFGFFTSMGNQESQAYVIE